MTTRRATLDTAPNVTHTRNLTVNSLALMGAAATNAVLGLAFWMLAARLYPVSEVGAAAAILNSSLALSAFANLSLGPMFERFLPLAGAGRPRLVALGLATSVGTSAIAGTGLGVVLLATGKVGGGAGLVGSVIGVVVVLALFALTDQIANGLGVGRWAAGKNVVHSATKLAVIAAVAVTWPTHGAIVVGWIVPATLTCLVLTRLLLRRSRVLAARAPSSHLPPRREMWSYFGSSYALIALGSATPLLIPLAIVAVLDTEANAYFATSWSMVSAVFVLMMMLVGPFVAEHATSGGDRVLLRRFATLLVGVAVIGGAGLAVLGPVLLGALGETYRDQGRTLCVLGAATLPFMAVSVLYGALSRIRRRLRTAIVAKTIGSVITIAGAFVLAGRIGVDGAGVAYLCGEFVATAIVVVPLLRALRAAQRDPVGNQPVPLPALSPMSDSGLGREP